MTASNSSPTYEIYAIRYATNTKRTRNDNFIKDSRPSELLPMDFYCWVLKGNGRTYVVDTGMAKAKAERSGHQFLVNPVDVMRKLGVDPATADIVIMAHLHYDHTGHTEEFPVAKFLVQADEMAYVLEAEHVSLSVTRDEVMANPRVIEAYLGKSAH